MTNDSLIDKLKAMTKQYHGDDEEIGFEIAKSRAIKIVETHIAAIAAMRDENSGKTLPSEPPSPASTSVITPFEKLYRKQCEEHESTYAKMNEFRKEATNLRALLIDEQNAHKRTKEIIRKAFKETAL